jgi:hypothetical protein
MQQAFRGNIQDLGGGRYRVGGTTKYPHTGTEVPWGRVFETGGPEFAQRLGGLSEAGKGIPGLDKMLGALRPGDEAKMAKVEAAVEAFKAQREAGEAAQKQHEEALARTKEATAEAEQAMQQTAQRLEEAKGSSTAAWDAVKESADEYVEAMTGRTQEVMDRFDSRVADLDAHIDQMGEDLDLGKAHDMQVAAQAAAGQITAGARRIAAKYGTNSPQYLQWQQAGNISLANAQSGIHATYAKLRVNMDTAIAGIKSAVAEREAAIGIDMARYESFAYAQRVETNKAAAIANFQNAVHVAEAELSIARLRLNHQENLANWIANTPTFISDATGLISYISDVIMPTEGMGASYSLPLGTTGGEPRERQVRGYAGQATGQAPSARYA